MSGEELRQLHQLGKLNNKDALNKLIKTFQPCIYKNSFIGNRFDEDCFQELNLKFIQCIKTFEFKNNENIGKYLTTNIL